MLRISMRNTTMNCWGTQQWRIRRLNQRWKEFESNLGEGIWLMESILTSHFEKNLRITLEKLEESCKILGKDLWVRGHSKEHRWAISWKGDCTSWIKWLEWGNSLEIEGTNLELKKRAFWDILSTPEQMKSLKWMIKRCIGMTKDLKQGKEYDQHQKLELNPPEKKKEWRMMKLKLLTIFPRITG